MFGIDFDILSPIWTANKSQGKVLLGSLQGVRGVTERHDLGLAASAKGHTVPPLVEEAI